MTDNPARPANGWSSETLFAYYERRFAELDKRIEEHFDALERTASDARAEAARAVVRAEAAVSETNIRLETIQQRMDRHEGSARGMASGWTTTVSAIVATGIVVTIIFSIVELLVAR